MPRRKGTRQLSEETSVRSSGSDQTGYKNMTPSNTTADDYFSVSPQEAKLSSKVTFSPDADLPSKNAADKDKTYASATVRIESTGTSTSSSTPSEPMLGSSRRSSIVGDDVLNDEGAMSRKSSVNSVSFRLPKNRALPQGTSKEINANRLRTASPTSVRFRPHVGFDNVPVGEATKSNTASCTLNVRHSGYHPKRRSRTFIVGVDEHAYSDYALKWLLHSLVDDGDEVVCVRVIENALRLSDNYLELAQKLLSEIQEKNTQNKAISIVLEYSVGKLHATFQQLIQIYQPSMLIVGTRGRSLGGLQGLMNTRNSFSKYCLQYSPVPVVVVRPDEMRRKKKNKRSGDPARQSYTHILAQNGGKHEIDSEASSTYEFERTLSPDEEAHRVAAAIGLPAAFDPTIKPYKSSSRRSSPHVQPSPPLGGPSRIRSPPPPDMQDSGDEESGEEDEIEVEAVSGEQLLQQDMREQALLLKQKQRLHAMEVGEAKALLKSGAGAEGDQDEDDEDDDSQDGESGARL